ncbi:MAG TPA: ATP-binding cassette domain-containing protein [Pirellulales bacterium]
MIDVVALSKRFLLPDYQELWAVKGVSFSVRDGEIYGLLGPNGAGKTTTLRMILGLLPSTSGYATIDGFRSSEQPDEVKRRVGLVSANSGVSAWLTVEEMLLYFADLYDVPTARAKEQLATLSELLDFRAILKRRCATLSTGQKQRVNLARALIHDPPIMLLDEPTLGLDVLASQIVAEYIAHVRSLGKAVIISTHHLDEAERYCTRFGLLHQGQLVAEGTLDELRERFGEKSLVEVFLKFAREGVAREKAEAARSSEPGIIPAAEAFQRPET